MNAILVISIYFGDLPNELVDELEKNMVIKVNNLINYSLIPEQFKDLDAGLKKIRNNKNKVLTFIVNAEFPLDLKCEVRYVPFDIVNLDLDIRLTTVHTEFLYKKTSIDFNIMYPYQKDENISEKVKAKKEKIKAGKR